MNDHELSQLLQQAKAKSPKPAPQLAARTLAAYREHHARPSFFRRHWRLATAAAVLAVVGGVVATRPSTGSPLPPEYRNPHVLGSGSMSSADGWTMRYTTVLQPYADGPNLVLSHNSDITERRPGKVIFHRYVADVNANLWYGYDAVLQTTHGMNGQVKIEPLSRLPTRMPEWLRAARIVQVRELPSQIFETGQRISVTMMPDAGGGRTVVDYLTVDTSLFDMVHHVFGHMLMTVHRHFESHEPRVQ